MVKTIIPPCLSLLLMLFAGAANAVPKRLMLFGGGSYSPTGLKRFLDLAGGPQAHIIYIPWADSTDNGQRFLTSVAALSPVPILVAPQRDLLLTLEPVFIEQLKTATGIFFGGGGQQNIMKMLTDFPEVKALLLQHYENGQVIGGSSAGLAIMSRRMMTGDENVQVISEGEAQKMADGFGLLAQAVVDSHFIARGRLNRLISALLGGAASLGIGVDERGAAYIEDGQHLLAFGPGQVIVLEQPSPGVRRLSLDVLREGERRELAGNLAY